MTTAGQPPTMSDAEASFVAAHRVGRLATADENGGPHVVPICYAFDGHHIYTAIDSKPKRRPPRRLKRVLNVLANPSVALVIDHYSDDWTELAYVLIEGSARFLESGDERAAAELLLREKYPQYLVLLPPLCPVIAITPTKTISWGRV